MSFFSDRPRHEPEEEEDEERRVPPWFEPPMGVLPGLLPDRAVLARTDRALITIDQFRVYPVGVEFSLNLWLRRKADQIYEFPWESFHRPGRPRADDSEILRYGVAFSDGTSWTNLDVDHRGRDFHEEPPGPVINGRGGGGGEDHWQTDLWLWPLPPAGDVTFVASWPAVDVPETAVVLDGSKFVEAAATAEVIWED